VHARTDGFTSLAVVVGAIGVWLGFPLADPINGLVISALILVVLRGAALDVVRRPAWIPMPWLLERSACCGTSRAPSQCGTTLMWTAWS